MKHTLIILLLKSNTLFDDPNEIKLFFYDFFDEGDTRMTIQYEEMDLAEIQKEYNKFASSAPVSKDEYLQKFVRLPMGEGYKIIRLLPRVSKGDKFYSVTRLHTLINPSVRDSSGKPVSKSYHCPNQPEEQPNGKVYWKGNCVVCRYYHDLWKQSLELSGKAQEDMQNKARALKPQERYYMNAIEREEDKEGNVVANVGPRIYSCPKTVFEKIYRAMAGDKLTGEKPLGDVTHPTKGRDFRIVKKIVKVAGPGGSQREYPNYDKSKFGEVSDAGTPEELEKWLENLHDLQAMRDVKSDEELRHALRVHLGLVRDDGGSKSNEDLDEFRNVSQTQNQASQTSQASETVREDLAVSSSTNTTSEDTPSATASIDDLLADDDFLRDMEQ